MRIRRRMTRRTVKMQDSDGPARAGIGRKILLRPVSYNKNDRRSGTEKESMMSRMFGTDGVRGIAGSELTIELATKLGQAGAYVLTKEQEHQATIIVGCDTRISGGMLASALMAGICSVGANAIFVGVMPTPAIAYLTRRHKVDAGVVISASHNPMEFNGIKFFNGEGYKV